MNLVSAEAVAAAAAAVYTVADAAKEQPLTTSVGGTVCLSGRHLARQSITNTQIAPRLFRKPGPLDRFLFSPVQSHARPSGRV